MVHVIKYTVYPVYEKPSTTDRSADRHYGVDVEKFAPKYEKRFFVSVRVFANPESELLPTERVAQFKKWVAEKPIWLEQEVEVPTRFKAWDIVADTTTNMIFENRYEYTESDLKEEHLVEGTHEYYSLYGEVYLANRVGDLYAARHSRFEKYNFRNQPLFFADCEALTEIEIARKEVVAQDLRDILESLK